MQRLDDFELAALDYCITYEVSPPAWAAARCQFMDLGFAGASADGQMFAFEGAVNTLKESAEKLPRLQGEVLGDASMLLEALDTYDVPGTKLVIDCSGLLRVDFSAAGSILNWVAIRQAQGNFVQFHNAHRLVAAFFNVIGINEHAKVIPRAI
jgi:ABC-type transporter Mla MlaB component